MTSTSALLALRFPDLLEVERAEIAVHFDPPVTIHRPVRQTVPLIFCSPHSGRLYPPGFLAISRLDPLSLRRSEDAFVDQLFASAVLCGAPLLTARFPRAYLDVNREPYELDPRLIEGPLPRGANIQSARVAGGLGTIPRLVSDGEDIYAGKLPTSVAVQRIDRLYHPFHQALAGLITETVDTFGVALLVDCHSMPSAPAGHPPTSRPHFVIGDRFGTACASEVTRTATRWLSNAGFEVSINRPYAGGFITEHYGRPQNRVHAIQIEINRALYLREAQLQPSAGFGAFASVIEAFVRTLSALSETWVRPTDIAAE